MNRLLLILASTCSIVSAAESELFKAFKDNNTPELESVPREQQKHSTRAEDLSIEQDQLAADVQELIQEETNEKVVTLLSEAEDLMAQTTDNLSRADTSGPTIAIPTEIIEKIAAAAKEKSKPKPGAGEMPNNPLLEMMQQMMGENPEPASPAEGESDQAGEGAEGDSDSANQLQSGASNGSKETRRVPKSSGVSGTKLPPEFQQALDAFNKAQTPSR